MIDDKEVELVHENQFQMADPNRQINYILHFGVFRLDKATTKCRPVFDNSSTNEDGISLNQQLLKGPKTLNSIKGMLMHTRMNPIVLNGDIQRFFYAIHYLEKVEHEGNVIENIRDLYRLLWSSEPNVPPKAYRFDGALMGGFDTPYVASAVVIHHMEKIMEESKDQDEIKTAQILKDSFYVDDLLVSFSSVEEACRFRKIASRIFSDIGMKLTKWTSNSNEVLKTIPEEEKATFATKEFQFRI